MSYVIRNGLLVPKREVARPKRANYLRVPRANLILRRHFETRFTPQVMPLVGAVSNDAIPGTGPDTGNLQTATSVSGLTNLTVVSSTALLLGWVVFDCTPVTPSSVTMSWASVSMTLLTSVLESDSLQSLWVFGLMNPTTGNQTLAVTWSGVNDCCATAVSFAGTATSLANAVPAVNIKTGNTSNASVPANYPSTGPFSITTMNGDAAIALAGSNQYGVGGCNLGTFIIYLSGAGPYNLWGGYRLATGNPTTIQFNGISDFAGLPMLSVFATMRIVSVANTGLQPPSGDGNLPLMGVG